MEFDLPRDWTEFIQLLNSNGVDFIVVGAFALAYHELPRATGDIDFFVGQDIQNMERLVTAIREFGFGYMGASVEDFLKPGAFVMLGREPSRIDLITAIDGVSFTEAWNERVFGLLGEQKIAFLSRGHLLKNKISTGRLKDKADVELLQRRHHDV